MKLRNISVITTNMAADFEQNSPTRASMETRQEQAVSVRFEITSDEIDLLRLKEEEVQKLGQNLALALLHFAQAGNPDWLKEEKKDETILQ